MADNDNPPPGDPPPGDPDPQETIRNLNAQLQAATGSTEAALNITRDALRSANPDLPDAVFQAETLEALTANVEAHRATVEHIRANPPPNPAGPPQVSPPGGGAVRTASIPDNLRGITKIAYALNHPGPGSTE